MASLPPDASFVDILGLLGGRVTDTSHGYFLSACVFVLEFFDFLRDIAIVTIECSTNLVIFVKVMVASLSIPAMLMLALPVIGLYMASSAIVLVLREVNTRDLRKSHERND